MGRAHLRHGIKRRESSILKKLGADVCINYQKDDFVSEVMKHTDGVGVDRVLECVGGDVLTKSFDALAPGGRLMIYGQRAAVFRPSCRSRSLPRTSTWPVSTSEASRGPEAVHRAALEEILDLVVKGKVKPVI